MENKRDGLIQKIVVVTLVILFVTITAKIFAIDMQGDINISPAVVRPPALNKLRADVVKDGVKLRWRGVGQGIYNIYRKEIDDGEDLQNIYQALSMTVKPPALSAITELDDIPRGLTEKQLVAIKKKLALQQILEKLETRKYAPTTKEELGAKYSPRQTTAYAPTKYKSIRHATGITGGVGSVFTRESLTAIPSNAMNGDTLLDEFGKVYVYKDGVFTDDSGNVFSGSFAQATFNKSINNIGSAIEKSGVSTRSGAIGGQTIKMRAVMSNYSGTVPAQIFATKNNKEVQYGQRNAPATRDKLFAFDLGLIDDNRSETKGHVKINKIIIESSGSAYAKDLKLIGKDGGSWSTSSVACPNTKQQHIFDVSIDLKEGEKKKSFFIEGNIQVRSDNADIILKFASNDSNVFYTDYAFENGVAKTDNLQAGTAKITFGRPGRVIGSGGRLLGCENVASNNISSFLLAQITADPDDDGTETASPLARLLDAGFDMIGQSITNSFLDTTAKKGSVYAYLVTLIKPNGIESEPSRVVQIYVNDL